MCSIHMVAMVLPVFVRCFSAIGMIRVFAARNAIAVPTVLRVLASGTSSAISSASLATPMIVSIFVFFSLFSFVIAAVSAASGVVESMSILRVSAPSTSSGFMSVRIVLGAAIATTMNGVASARPILRLSANGSLFLLVPIGSVALSNELGIAVMARAIIMDMYRIPAEAASLTRYAKMYTLSIVYNWFEIM